MGKSLRSLVLVGGLLLVVAVGGSAYAAVSSTVGSTVSDAVRQTGSNITLSTAGNVQTTIASLSLPPGGWVFHADASIEDKVKSDLFRCAIYRGATQIGIATADLGGVRVGSLSLTAATETTAAFAVHFKCWHDGAITAGPTKVYSGATLWAHKASNLDYVRLP